LRQLKQTRNTVNQLCFNIATGTAGSTLTPPLFDTWAQSVEHKFDLDYLVELDKVAKISFNFGDPEMDLQDILIGKSVNSIP
jgi:hypothetical protein